jgi:hypothetical protein
MKKLILSLTLLLFSIVPEMLSQVDCNGVPLACLREARYGFRSCETDNLGNLNLVTRCYSRLQLPLPNNIIRTNIPVCFDYFYYNRTAPSQMIIANTNIFNTSAGAGDFQAAADAWNCICGYPANSENSNCCFKLEFSTNVVDFGNGGRNRAAQAQYSSRVCFIECANSLTWLKVNISPEFIQGNTNPKRNVRGFYTGTTLPLPPSDQYAIYSLRDVVQHELGHLLGFPHNDGGCDDGNNSIMAREARWNELPRGLSQEDKCRFAYLYCHLLVDVEEEKNDNKYKGSLIVKPSPVETALTVKYNVPKTSQVTIKIIDINGKTVKSLKSASETIGDKEEIYNLSDLLNGTYFIVVKIGKQELSRKIIKAVR